MLQHYLNTNNNTLIVRLKLIGSMLEERFKLTIINNVAGSDQDAHLVAELKALLA